MTETCEHGTASHDGTESSAASAPEASRAWLLIEHPGPWPHEPTEAALPPRLAALVAAAATAGVRVQMIRRPGPGPGRGRLGEARSVYAGWTEGAQPWLRHASWSEASEASGYAVAAPDVVAALDVEKLAGGSAPEFGSMVGEPVYLVCTHAQRSACCARWGGPLAQALAARYPGQVFRTTHVGGHRFAANLVILPHGLYYGPVGLDGAVAAIGAYERGAVMAQRYRGRAGQPRAAQEAEYQLLAQAGSLELA